MSPRTTAAGSTTAKSSTARTSAACPSPFRLTGVIKAWTEGLQYVGKGGMIELEVPPSLGYGALGQGPIPPNERLHFLIELIDVR